MAEFDLPTEAYQEIEALIESGDLAAAQARFQELTDVSSEDAVYYVEQMSTGLADAEVLAAENAEAPEQDSSTSPPPPPTLNLPKDIAPAPMSVSPAAETLETPTAQSSADSDDWIVRNRISKKEKKALLKGDAPEWYEWLWVGPKMIVDRLIVRKRVLFLLAILGGTYVVFVHILGGFNGPEDRFELDNQVDVREREAVKETKKRTKVSQSDTADWQSFAGALKEGTDQEWQAIHALRHKPPVPFGPVTVNLNNSQLSITANDVPLAAPQTGIALVDNEGGLTADLGKGGKVTLAAVAISIPSLEKETETIYRDPETGGEVAMPGGSAITHSKFRKHPVLRCVFEVENLRSPVFRFHLFDAGTQRRIAPAEEATLKGGASRLTVDFKPGIWHKTPLAIYVEGVAERLGEIPTGAPAVLPTGQEVELGLGRIQIAYLGPGRLDGVPNGGTIDCQKSYSIVPAPEDQTRSAMVIARVSPPYIADELELGVRSGDVFAPLPRFNHDDFMPFAPDGDRLGFRVYWFRPLGDRRPVGTLTTGKLKGMRANSPLNFDGASAVVKINTQSARGMIVFPGISEFPSGSALGNLFDLKIPYIRFKSTDSLADLLETAAAAVEFTVAEIDPDLAVPKFGASQEYTDLTPAEALLEFERLMRVRVVIDSEQRTIRLQP